MNSRLCADCGQYNASYRKSEFCSLCRIDHSHAFVKPTAELRRARYGLASANCHCEKHVHSDCVEGSGTCAVDCYGFKVAAPVHGCGVCRLAPDAPIHSEVK